MSAVSAEPVRELTNAFRDGTLVKMVLALGQGEFAGAKTSVRPVEIKGDLKLQWAERKGKQEVHANLSIEASCERLKREFPQQFHQVNLLTTEADYEYRIESKGKLKTRKGKPSTRKPVETSHNESKQYLIPEGQPCPFLEAVGVMTSDGRVKAAMQHKFRQINRFLEFVNDIVSELPAEGTLRVVDFGCGKSYLTLAIHHLLTVIHKRSVDIIGIDRTEAVVETCRSVAQRLELKDLRFEVGDITTAAVEGPVHLAVALHACDTATDAALIRAAGWQANVILAAPCCQHEVASQMNSSALELFQTHGILKERVASLATDAMRAAALEGCGYRTQVIEFVDLDHTPKNLLIRAVRRDQPTEEQKQQAWQKLVAMKQLLGVEKVAIEGIVS